MTSNNKVWKKIAFAAITTTKIRVLTTASVDGYSRITEVEAWTAASGGGSSATVRWLVSDQLGTPRMIFDQSGSLANVSRHDYLPFGEELYAGIGGRTTGLGYTASDSVRQKFTQKERDNETGLDYFGARYYGSSQGRFTSADDFVNDTHPAKPESWNLYAYARNNPLKFIDPAGEEVVDTNLTEKQRKQLIEDWKKKTGYKDVQFKDGKLVVNEKAGFEGGSKQAREQLLAAVNSADTFKLAAVDGTDATKDVRFADSQLTGVRRDSNIYTVRIDFGDFNALQGDRDAVESFSVGLNVLHEFQHPFLDPSSALERNSVGNPGPIESNKINPIRQELGLPQRQQYLPQSAKQRGYDYLTFKAKDGTQKIVRWQKSMVDGVRKP